MKKTIIALFASTLLLASCNQKAETKTLDTTAEDVAEAIDNTNKEGDNKETKKEKKMGTILITKAEFLTKIANYEANPNEWKYLGDKPAIIDFYADWCGPCKTIAPILEQLATDYNDDIYIYKVDVDSETELASLFGIRSIPSMLFIPMEGQPQMSTGAAPKSELEKAIKTLLLEKQV